MYESPLRSARRLTTQIGSGIFPFQHPRQWCAAGWPSTPARSAVITSAVVIALTNQVDRGPPDPRLQGLGNMAGIADAMHALAPPNVLWHNYLSPVALSSGLAFLATCFRLYLHLPRSHA